MKVRKPGLSSACYHCHRGRGECSVSLFQALPENRALEKVVELNSALKRKERGVPHFTEDNLQRIIINPFYAITVAPQLTKERQEPNRLKASGLFRQALLD